MIDTDSETEIIESQPKNLFALPELPKVSDFSDNLLLDTDLDGLSIGSTRRACSEPGTISKMKQLQNKIDNLNYTKNNLIYQEILNKKKSPVACLETTHATGPNIESMNLPALTNSYHPNTLLAKDPNPSASMPNFFNSKQFENDTLCLHRKLSNKIESGNFALSQISDNSHMSCNNVLSNLVSNSVNIDTFSNQSSSSGVFTESKINSGEASVVYKSQTLMDFCHTLNLNSSSLAGHPIVKDGLLTSTNLRTKPGMKCFSCKVCHKVFQRLQHLQRHILSVHTSSRPFKCVYCGKDFKRSEHLRGHCLKYHGNLPSIMHLYGGHRKRGRPANNNVSQLGNTAILQPINSNGKLKVVEPTSFQNLSKNLAQHRHQLSPSKRTSITPSPQLASTPLNLPSLSPTPSYPSLPKLDNLYKQSSSTLLPTLLPLKNDFPISNFSLPHPRKNKPALVETSLKNITMPQHTPSTSITQTLSHKYTPANNLLNSETQKKLLTRMFEDDVIKVD